MFDITTDFLPVFENPNFSKLLGSWLQGRDNEGPENVPALPEVMDRNDSSSSSSSSSTSSRERRYRRRRERRRRSGNRRKRGFARRHPPHWDRPPYGRRVEIGRPVNGPEIELKKEATPPAAPVETVTSTWLAWPTFTLPSTAVPRSTTSLTTVTVEPHKAEAIELNHNNANPEFSGASNFTKVFQATFRFKNDFDCDQRWLNTEFAHSCQGITYAFLMLLHCMAFIMSSVPEEYLKVYCSLWGFMLTYSLVYFYGFSSYSKKQPLPDLYQTIIFGFGVAVHALCAIVVWDFDEVFIICALLSFLQYLALKRFLHGSYLLDILCCPCKLLYRCFC